MKVVATVVATVLLSACDCGRSHELPDAAVDDAAPGPEDGAAPRDAGDLPEVTAMSPACAELAPSSGVQCVEHGWFSMARWSTMTSYNGLTEARGLPRPRQPVFLETFLIDRTEVTVNAYRSFLAETGREPPPVQCGYQEREGVFEDPIVVRETSDLVDARSDNPVVCVTREEAGQYCAARGGRLPSVAEWMRAGQEPYPAFRRFPWGDSPPPLDEIGWVAGHPEFMDDYVAFGFYGHNLGTVPVGTRTLGISPSGALDLAGNVSELLLDCIDQLHDTYGASTAPLIRPASPPPVPCSSAVLVGGSNWRSSDFAELAGSQTIWQMTDGLDGIRALEGDEMAVGIGDSLTRERTWGIDNRPVDETVPMDGAGNLRRSWRIGFRCAYEP
jgi:formylglycine-generating enzyme required for sulfatase activity